MHFFIILISILCCPTIHGITFVVPPRQEHIQALNGLRASSDPYISGDSFRASADFIIDEKRIPFDPAHVQHSDTIFVNADYLDFFFTTIHPHIAQPYILITHNSDVGVPGRWEHHLNDPKIIAWFGQNGTCTHEKFTCIPIGIANRYWKHGDINTFNRLKNTKIGAKKYLLYLNFSDATNKERSTIRTLFSNKAFCHSVLPTKPHHEYLHDFTQSTFVLSPEGNGLDCHRTWEALLMGAIPIIKHSTLDPVFEGLPVVLINDWNDITQEFLEHTYNTMQKKRYDTERMYVHYWLNKITNLKTKRSTHRKTITYGLSGGRLGNNLLSCFKALWLAEKYDYNFVYRPFPYSNQLMLDNCPLSINTAHYQEVINCDNESELTAHKKNTCLYNISYYAHLEDWSDWDKGFYPLDNNERFINLLRKLIAPKVPLDLITPPSDKISVAVHMRRGGGFDSPLLSEEPNPKKEPIAQNYVDKAFPLIFLPTQFYIDQIKTLSELLNDQPMYIHLFTDDSNPQNLIEIFQQQIAKPNITYGYRTHNNKHNNNVLEDLFSITQFQCFIRSDSTFAKSAQILGDFAFVIYPEHAYWKYENKKHTLLVDKVTVLKNKELL